MATSKSSNEEPQTEVDAPAEKAEATPTAQPNPQESPEATTESGDNFYKLPPAMSDAGGVGVVGLVSGLYTVSSGSYQVTPGTPMLMSPEDAQTLIDQGVAVSMDNYPIPRLMPYNVPNGPDVPNVDLAEPDNADYVALGYHRTGVVSGGVVTASTATTVSVTAAEIVINGVPYTKSSGSVVLDSGGANPRFDIVGWNATGGPVAIKGTLSTNPVIPAFDQTTFCMSAVVYVGAGVSAITNTYIVQKQVTLPSSIRRNYAIDSEVVLDWSTPTKTSALKALANGTLSWAASTLTRTADAALSWATSLTILQNVPTDKALVLKAAVGAAKGNNLLEVQASGSTTALAAVDAIGRLSGLNLRTGSGTPQGVVTADKGTLYINDTPGATGDDALWVKTTDGASTGWFALAAYVASAQAIPVGCVLPWPGTIGTNAIPTGYLLCNGSEQSSASYSALSTFCGTKFGTAAGGNFRLPDYRGKTLFGVDGTLATVPGVNIGAATQTLTATQLPTHTHMTSNEKHVHPQPGLVPYVVPQAYLPPYNLGANNGSGIGIAIQAETFDRSVTSPVTVATTGEGQPFSLYQPSQSVNWIMKT